MTMRIWLAGLAVYIMAVAARTSFGVASLDALSQFEISAAELSLFTVVQLAVYAGCQIPLGILLDRYGSRPIIIGGAIILAGGQVWLAFAGTYPSALAARILIGMGDATAYTSVLRLIPQWFPPGRVPLYTQLTSFLGQVGQVISSIPFAMTLAHFGWETSFLAMGIVGGIVGLLAAVFIREKEQFVPNTEKTAIKSLTHPGVWQGFWAHFTLGFPGNVFLLLWGVPLMAANGIDQSVASALLIVCSVAGIVTGPLVARMVSRHPLRRGWPVITIALILTLSWAWVLTRPRPVEEWEFAILLVVLALGASGSGIGFDFARTSVPIRGLGVANGLVNQGAFFAALISSYIIGLVLDHRAPDGNYELADFKVALSTQFILIGIGVAGFLIVGRSATKRFEQDRGTTIEPARIAIERILREFRADRIARAGEKEEMREQAGDSTGRRWAFPLLDNRTAARTPASAQSSSKRVETPDQAEPTKTSKEVD